MHHSMWKIIPPIIYDHRINLWWGGGGLLQWKIVKLKVLPCCKKFQEPHVVFVILFHRLYTFRTISLTPGRYHLIWVGSWRCGCLIGWFCYVIFHCKTTQASRVLMMMIMCFFNETDGNPLLLVLESLGLCFDDYLDHWTHLLFLSPLSSNMTQVFETIPCQGKVLTIPFLQKPGNAKHYQPWYWASYPGKFHYWQRYNTVHTQNSTKILRIWSMQTIYCIL